MLPHSSPGHSPARGSAQKEEAAALSLCARGPEPQPASPAISAVVSPAARRDKPALTLNLSLIGALQEHYDDAIVDNRLNTESAESTLRELEQKGAALKAELKAGEEAQPKDPDAAVDDQAQEITRLKSTLELMTNVAFESGVKMQEQAAAARTSSAERAVLEIKNKVLEHEVKRLSPKSRDGPPGDLLEEQSLRNVVDELVTTVAQEDEGERLRSQVCGPARNTLVGARAFFGLAVSVGVALAVVMLGLLMEIALMLWW